ncbi:MAG: T6SS effector amidase Tae4 family protein [Saprospiraceae bacterium]
MSDINYWKSEWEAVTSTDELFDMPNPQSGESSTNSNKRPNWVDVYRGYPKNNSETDDLPAELVFKEILGENYDKSTFTNACATRVSLGLLDGGMDVKREFNIQKGKFKGKGFIASAKNLQVWLSKTTVWNSPDEFIKGPSTLSDVQNRINGRNGVYTIIGGFGGGVTGHATLWVGSKKDVIGGHNYVDYGGDIYFWELK